MKLKPKALANSLAAIGFIAFIICLAWASIDTSSFVSFWETWAHGFNLDVIVGDNVGSINGNAVFGLVSFTASSWIAGYGIAWLYNVSMKEA